jgi:hypothetical protein
VAIFEDEDSRGLGGYGIFRFPSWLGGSVRLRGRLTIPGWLRGSIVVWRARCLDVFDIGRINIGRIGGGRIIVGFRSIGNSVWNIDRFDDADQKSGVILSVVALGA